MSTFFYNFKDAINHVMKNKGDRAVYEYKTTLFGHKGEKYMWRVGEAGIFNQPANLIPVQNKPVVCDFAYNIKIIDPIKQLKPPEMKIMDTVIETAFYKKGAWMFNNFTVDQAESFDSMIPVSSLYKDGVYVEIVFNDDWRVDPTFMAVCVDKKTRVLYTTRKLEYVYDTYTVKDGKWAELDIGEVGPDVYEKLTVKI